MKAKVTIFKNRESKKGYPLVIRLTHQGRKKYHSLKVYVDTLDWDHTNARLKYVMPVAADHPNFEKYQDYKKTKHFIDQKQKAYDRKIEELARTGRPFTFDKVIEQVENPPQEAYSVFQVFQKRITELDLEERHGNAKAYNDAWLRLKEYTSNKDVMFYEMDDEFLIGFRRYYFKKGSKPNTIGKYLRTLRGLFNYAIQKGIARQNDYPFKKNKEIMVGLTTSTYNSRAITKYEIDSIRQLDINEKSDQVSIFSDQARSIKIRITKARRRLKAAETDSQINEHKKTMQELNDELSGVTLKLKEARLETYMWHARNYFIMGYVGRGTNFIDLARLKWTDLRDGRAYYVRFKTRHKVKEQDSFQITPELQGIIRWYRKNNRQLNDPYVFPILNGSHITEKQKLTRIHRVRREVNLALKEIGQKIGTRTNLTTYVWRHSFAAVSVEQGVEPIKIQQMMRHKSLATTQHYLKQFDHKDLDEAIVNL